MCKTLAYPLCIWNCLFLRYHALSRHWIFILFTTHLEGLNMSRMQQSSSGFQFISLEESMSMVKQKHAFSCSLSHCKVHHQYNQVEESLSKNRKSGRIEMPRRQQWYSSWSIPMRLLMLPLAWLESKLATIAIKPPRHHHGALCELWTFVIKDGCMAKK